MNFKRLLQRVATVYGLMVCSIIAFYLITAFYVKNMVHFVDVHVNIAAHLTYLFFGFSLLGSVVTVIIIYRDYRRKEKFLKEIEQFSEMVSQGAIADKVFFEDYPDLAGVYNSLNDITRRLNEKFARTEEERSQLNAILESIPDALAIIDNKNELVYVNDNASEFFNYKGPIKNKPLIEIIRSSDLISMLDNVKKYDKTSSGEIFLEYPFEKYMQVRMYPFYKKNDLTGVVILFHDITELKKLETMRKDFVANVSHEIKTPVTAIKGFAETLIEGAINDKEDSLKFLKIIIFHSERLNRLVDDLMTISKIELGVSKLQKTDIDFSQIIDDVIETLRGSAEAKGLYIRKSVDSKCVKSRLALNADRDRVIQVLLNIVDNAIKFTQTGGIEVGFGTDSRRCFFFVRDTGSGIPKRCLSRLGERFYRVDPSRSRELGGTGLGLAIVKHIVKAHDWELKIESEEGAGTTIKIIVER
ncbi:sensor histidine kinase [Candidatus Magnetominusculus xianensis]|uniref:histidine kinase n=1 Tax=Candidatus Magnetominusculus xianensis TaxID=1748249 RepID=A0ABR5SC01_9BACT|nr:ATP-binding protein [Candidatus Magnetominusculus xianensis]KWT78404.1 PAS domain-containing sensor histidine kinase [Candidatus Magnetominusculus xianensis]MBF0403168.1 PAS domain S-box protein [Nitrospirota bacterium]